MLTAMFGRVESTVKSASDVSAERLPARSVAVIFTRTVAVLSAGIPVQRYEPVLASELAIIVHVLPFVEYESVIGVDPRLVSEAFVGFQVMRIPVPVLPLRYSPPLGVRIVSAATLGLVESITNVRTTFAVFPSLSTAVKRSCAVGRLDDGTVQLYVPLFAIDVATGDHALPSGEYSIVIGVASGLRSLA